MCLFLFRVCLLFIVVLVRVYLFCVVLYAVVTLVLVEHLDSRTRSSPDMLTAGGKPRRACRPPPLASAAREPFDWGLSPS